MEEKLTKQNMESAEALARINMLVSEAQNTLSALKADESVYLSERESKTLKVIDKIFKDSEKTVTKIKENNREVSDLANLIVGFVHNITGVHADFKQVVADFNKKADLWEERAEGEEKRLADIRKGIDIDQKNIVEARKSVALMMKEVEKEKKVIESRQAQIKTALQVLENKELKRG